MWTLPHSGPLTEPRSTCRCCGAGSSITLVQCPRGRVRGRQDLARDVYDLFAGICPVVLDVTLADTDRARDLLCAHTAMSSRDAGHAAVMLNHRVERIATFDAGFDQIPGIKRVRLR